MVLNLMENNKTLGAHRIRHTEPALLHECQCFYIERVRKGIPVIYIHRKNQNHNRDKKGKKDKYLVFMNELPLFPRITGNKKFHY